MADNMFYENPCMISMCPPDSSTDLDYLIENAGAFNNIESPDKFIVEFGGTYTQLQVNPGQIIKDDDFIGYVDNIQVKSKVKGTVTEVHENYFMGSYANELSDIIDNISDLNNMSPDDIVRKFGDTTNSSFDKINELMKESANVNTFIKDYILRFRFADIASNTISHIVHNSTKSSISTSQICKSYNKAADKIINEYNDVIQKVCSSNNVKSYCERNDLTGLKKVLDDKKKLYFGKIISQYRNVSSFGYNSGHIADLMLYDEYLDYITSDNFVYDEQNPYIVELLYHITTFLQVRSRLEFNGSNIANLIAKFTSMCDNVIRRYWDGRTYDYYGRLKEIFQYDFYAANTDDFVEANIFDKDRVTLYSKVLKYLQNLCGYVEPKSADEKYKSLDVNTIINSGEIADTAEEKRAKQLNSSLKKISIFFVQLRRIETEIDPKYFEQFADPEFLEDIFTLKQELGNLSIRDYIVQYNAIMSNVSNTTDTLAVMAAQTAMTAYEQTYLNPFKRLAERESLILRSLSDKAVKWYLDNDDKINSGELFEQFKEATWSGKTTIYKDKEPYDFYFITKPDDSEKSDNYPYSETSVKSKYGVSDFQYWMKYCAMATLVNCMLPMYWATGIIISGAPVLLPIIYIPILVIPGRVTTVIGIGLCGICPLPMLLFVNLSNMPGSVIPVINLVVDTIRKTATMMMDTPNITIKKTVEGLIEEQDKQINELNKQKKEITDKILTLQKGVETDKETLRNLKKQRNEDPTTNTNNGE